MSQLSSSLSERPKGILSSQSLTNPRYSSQSHLAHDEQLNQCNVVHILRLGKQVDNQVSISPTPFQHNHKQAFISSSLTPSNSDKSEKDKSAD